MFKQLTYKRKNQLLIVGALLVLYLMYSMAIKKTLLAYNDYMNTQSHISIAINAPLLAAQLENKIKEMNTQIGSTTADKQNAEQALIELITNYCQNNSLVLREFPEMITTTEGDLTIETNRFVIGGNFKSLINMVYLLEQKKKLGKIASVRYLLKKNIKTKEMDLCANIYLQNIKQNQQ